MQAHIYSATPIFNSVAEIAGAKITVMGLGLNGGGLAAALFLLKHGASVTVTDLKSAEDLAPSVKELTEFAKTTECDNRLRLVLGTHELDDFKHADVVIKNPGAKFEGNQFLACAKAIETDLSLFLRFTSAPIIAVTGSKGKSSTVSAIHYGLQQAGFTAFLGGNITVSPLTFLARTSQDTPVVIELSSWQLADLRGRGILKPKIAILTKIVPDHQNWYGNMENYVADKKLIYSDQNKDDFTICGSDEWGTIFAHETRAKVLRYSAEIPKEKKSYGVFLGAWLDTKKCGWVRLAADTEPVFTLGSELAVPGLHLRENVLNAALVLSIMGVAPSRTAAILARYPGIQHRLEFFHRWQPPGSNATVLFYNDSAATVPEAAAAAIKAFETPIHVICGGTDKNLLFEPLVKEIGTAKSVYVLAGTGSDKLLSLLKARSLSYFGPFDSLENLLETLKKNIVTVCSGTTSEKEIVVFSPGATSFGMFKNEFDRGIIFKNLVQSYFTEPLFS